MADRCVVDRFVADRLVTDRFVTDGFVADRCVVDRFVADRFVADRLVTDRLVADRFGGICGAALAIFTVTSEIGFRPNCARKLFRQGASALNLSTCDQPQRRWAGRRSRKTQKASSKMDTRPDARPKATTLP